MIVQEILKIEKSLKVEYDDQESETFDIHVENEDELESKLDFLEDFEF